ncbi:phospholipase D-like domain-containing protein [Teredinibacter haidensis]|uniref:phospholipase D-like domain-containing protein n=1 Tax=Teredinibacter haidensis TaxID=2731755 RepID=UPI000948F30B|nr:phospholipase D-like domain-containing protein [Teredinibacter haidensis]
MTLTLGELEQELRFTFEDLRLSGSEKSVLKSTMQALNEEQKRFMHNKCFDLYREHLAHAIQRAALEELPVAAKWLERTLKAIGSTDSYPSPNSYFSPGEACRKAIIDTCHETKKQMAICVFTISDNHLTNAIVRAHNRGVNVRIITDDDKSFDKGSDIHYLAEQGVPVKLDNSPHHMHHKFAIFDQHKLLNGSFNWTRSASEKNQENLMLSYHPKAVQDYQQKFEQLWNTYKEIR